MLEVDVFSSFIIFLLSQEIAFWVLYYETRLEHSFTRLKLIVFSHFFLKGALLLGMLYFEIPYLYPAFFLFVFLVYSSYDLLIVAFPIPEQHSFVPTDTQPRN